MNKITPHLWFDKEAKDAAEFYTSLFPDSKVTNITTLHDTPSGDTDIVSFEIAGSNLWPSVLEAELVTVNTTEGAAYRAALLAGVGAGAWADVPSASLACIKITGSTQPDTSQVDAYRQSYSLYQDLYPALRSSFSRMGGTA